MELHSLTLYCFIYMKGIELDIGKFLATKRLASKDIKMIMKVLYKATFDELVAVVYKEEE